MKNGHKRILVTLLMLMLLTGCGKEAAPAPVEEAPAAAPTLVTIEADGREYTFEDADGKDLPQLLEQAGITLGAHDLLLVAPDQVFPGELRLQLRRTYNVTVIVAAENFADSIRHAAVLTEGTVADAIAAVGLELGDNSFVSHELDAPLTDGMEIIISGDKLLLQADPLDPADPEGTEPADPSAKTIVSIEVYEDCDGSGHGIKIITYSDGTQEEVPF